MPIRKKFGNLSYAPRIFIINISSGILTDQLISAKGPDLAIISKKAKKKNWSNCELCCPRGPQSKSEIKQKEKYVPSLARKLKKLWNIRVTVTPIVIGALGTVTK